MSKDTELDEIFEAMYNLGWNDCVSTGSTTRLKTSISTMTEAKAVINKLMIPRREVEAAARAELRQELRQALGLGGGE